MTTTGSVLGAGDRAEVHEWLPGAEDGDPRGPAVLKVHVGEGAHTRALAEAAALASFDHDHVVALLGVRPTENGVVGLLLPRLSTLSARAWLEARGTITAGESVTLLVPLLSALLHLERRGLDARLDCAGAVTFDDVLFDERGAPVVVSVRPIARAVSSPGCRGTARRLVAEVLALTRGGDPAARATLDALTAPLSPPSSAATGGTDDVVDLLIEAVYELGVPVPLEAALPPEPDTADTSPIEVPVRAQRWWEGLVPGAALVLDWLDGVSVARVRSALAEVRPRVWLLAGVVLVSLIGAPALLGSADDSTPNASGRAPRAMTTPSPTRSAALPLDHRTPSPDPEETDPEEADLLGDDPAAAAKRLLALREACLRALDTDCIRDIDQDDSPAAQVDHAAVAAPKLLEDVPVQVTLGREVNRLGGTVLFDGTRRGGGRGSNDEPVSVLVVRTETGWRLRDVVASQRD